jgi:hypothetical protein
MEPDVIMTARAAGALRRRVALALVGVSAVAICACGGDDDPQPVAVDASTYVAAIDEFLPPSADPEERPVVFIVPVADESLALETQVAVIDALAETHDVRFVDDPAAAVDDGIEGEPTRDGGTLLGVGVVTAVEPHTIRVEVYRERGEVEAHLVTVAVRGERWVAIDDVAVEPEVLVGD